MGTTTSFIRGLLLLQTRGTKIVVVVGGSIVGCTVGCTVGWIVGSTVGKSGASNSAFTSMSVCTNYQSLVRGASSYAKGQCSTIDAAMSRTKIRFFDQDIDLVPVSDVGLIDVLGMREIDGIRQHVGWNTNLLKRSGFYLDLERLVIL